MNMIFLHRISRWGYLHRIPLLSKFIQLFIFLLYNSRIPGSVKIGKGSYFAYKGIATVLVSKTEIGDDCVLGFRLSTVRKFPYKDVPKIGNNVWIGPNVIIAGPVIIEDNVIIAGNSFVDKSVPEGAIVAGNPAKIIGHRKDLDYKIEENPQYKDGTMPFLQDNRPIKQ